jgi:competence protein ComFC
VRPEPPFCPRCGASLPSGRGCRDCRARAFPLVARSFARYEGPLRRAILQLKYRPNRRLAAVMGGWLADLYRGQAWQATLILPVPLAGRRQRLRGYNQASLIASALAERVALPMEEGGLRRVRETPSQVGLDPAGRLQNVEGAFEANPAVVHNQTLLVIDDLFTTGATLAACAQAGLRAGARRVYALTVARAR